jgi:hypothetical protein
VGVTSVELLEKSCNLYWSLRFGSLGAGAASVKWPEGVGVDVSLPNRSCSVADNDETIPGRSAQV